MRVMDFDLRKSLVNQKQIYCNIYTPPSALIDEEAMHPLSDSMAVNWPYLMVG